jgi:hypothetical protein
MPSDDNSHQPILTAPEGADVAVFLPLLDWWRQTSMKQGRLPTRADFRPEELSPTCLPHIVMTEIEPDAARIRIRLFGGAHVAFNQRDYTGRYLDEIYASDGLLPYVTGLYRDLQTVARPLWTVNEVRHPRNGNPLTVRRLMLPLARDGIHVDLCLAAQTFETHSKLTPEVANAWHVSQEAGERERRYL